MTTQQQTDQPPELGERVAKLEGRFDELSPRIDNVQRSVDSLRAEVREEVGGLRTEVREDFSSLRSELSSFKNNTIFLILGAWFTLMAGIAAVFITQFV